METDFAVEDLVFQPSQSTCFLLANYKAFSRTAEANMPEAVRALCTRDKFRELAALAPPGKRGRWQVGCGESRSA